MSYYTASVSGELQETISVITEKSREVGLDFFTTVFEPVDYQQLCEVAAYGGFPTRYPHWRWGMEYEKLSKSYTYGLSIIYEMVINNDPCYAYLLSSNSMVMQKTVIAHVLGHCDFFKNNYWFSQTNRKMLDQMANHATYVRNIIEDVGFDEVESFIDVCLSLENLIDIQSPFQTKHKRLSQEEKEQLAHQPVTKLDSKKYMDRYVNPDSYLKSQKEKIEQDAQDQMKIPEQPEKDVLGFLIEYAPMKSWEKKILSIIRDEAYYFAPQGQTKIINEGWATYWHSKMMTDLTPLHASEIVDYCDHFAGIVGGGPGSVNPYKLGLELLRYIEYRWDTGKYGIEYVHLDDPKDRWEWHKETGKGREKLFEVRKFHNDVSFVDEFFDEDFCHEKKMFLYDFDPRTGKYVITSRNFSEIKQQFLGQITNFGMPTIKVVDANYKNRGELLLKHEFVGTELKAEYAVETLRNLFKVWNRPVHIETKIENIEKRISFDGNNQSMEKL